MAVKKESVEIKCPDCKIEFRLWVPTTHLTLWEGDDGERVNCVRCPTHFKIRKTLDGVKVFKLQRTLKDTALKPEEAATSEKAPENISAPEEINKPPAEEEPSTIAFNGGDDDEVAAKETPEQIVETHEPEEVKTTIQKETKEEGKPLIEIDEEETPEPLINVETPAPLITIEEVEEEILELDAVEVESASTMGLSQHGETVLFVEDDSLSRAVAENSLIDLNITLISAVDGEDALNILSEKQIDLFVTDLHLSSDENKHPQIDGEHLLQTIADKKLGIPAIVTTGKEMIDDIAMDPKWFSLNVKGFVQKGSPFWSEELKDKIKEIINKPG